MKFNQFLISFYKRNVLRGKGAKVFDRELRIPDFALFNIEIEWNHLAVFTPETVENALDDRGFPAFSPGEDDPGLGERVRDIIDPPSKVAKFSFTADKKLRLADFFFLGVFHNSPSMV
ncbi:MAG: hypothetical protein GY866_30650 [Proteobacteria bacterium]|nr:hypothetical protein [Pseudomonadota bacterium]